MTNDNKKIFLFIGAIIAQIAIVFLIIIFKFSTSASGESVLLHVAPIDPYDPLRGNYVALRYDISTIDSYYFSPGFYNGQTVYVPVKKIGEYHQQSGPVVTSIPTTNPGRAFSEKPIYLKARIVSGGENKGDVDTNDYYNYGRVTLTYDSGEQYFIPEGTGDRIPVGSDAAALLKVAPNGKAVISKLYINGKEWGK